MTFAISGSTHSAHSLCYSEDLKDAYITFLILYHMTETEGWRKLCESIPLFFFIGGPSLSQVQSFYDPNVEFMKILGPNTKENSILQPPSSGFQLRKCRTVMGVVVSETLECVLQARRTQFSLIG